jgi:hypothetical protein
MMNNNHIVPETLGQAADSKATKGGQELGLINEMSLLSCIKQQTWIRESEVSLLTGMSDYTVGMVSRRLEKKGEIYRDRIKGNAGYFLRLKATGAARVNGQSGKDIDIPKSWAHDVMAIQTLHSLSLQFDCSYETEASLRHHLPRSGKIPDGQLISPHAEYYFEQENSRKSGRRWLQRQTDEVIKQAQLGRICFVAYPYPAAICGGIDHETRHTNSIRHKWGSPVAPNIRLVRCHFDSLIAYQNMHISRIEVIDLPALVNTPAANKVPHIDQTRGFQWKMTERRIRHGAAQQIDAELSHDGVFLHNCLFTEGIGGDDHCLDNDYLLRSAVGDAAQQTFSDFMLIQKIRIVEQVENSWVDYHYTEEFC